MDSNQDGFRKTARWSSLLHAEEPDALASTYYLIPQNNDAEGWSSPSMYQPVGQGPWPRRAPDLRISPPFMFPGMFPAANMVLIYLPTIEF